MDEGTLELLKALGSLLCALLGYALGERGRRRRMREQVIAERRKHPTQITVAIEEEVKNALRGVVKEAIGQYLGSLLRQVVDHSGKLEVMLKDALSRNAVERDDARASRERTYQIQQAVRDELVTLRKAVEALRLATEGLSRLWA